MLLIGNTDHAYSLFWIVGLSELRALGFMLFPIADTFVWEPVFSISWQMAIPIVSVLMR